MNHLVKNTLAYLKLLTNSTVVNRSAKQWSSLWALRSFGKLLILSTHIRLAYMYFLVTNTLAYC